jgi:NADH-quinone oxidoreductase subunit L
MAARPGAHAPEDPRQVPHPHESPAVMTWPMILLAIGSVGAGMFLVLGGRLASFLAPVTGTPPTAHGVFTAPGLGALGLVVVAVALAWAMYGRREAPAVAPAGRFPVVAARKDLYGDAFNESVLMRPGQWLTRLSVFFDNRGIDGLVNTVAATMGGSSGRLRRVQTGFVRSYALAMFFGAVLLVGALLLVRL